MSEDKRITIEDIGGDFGFRLKWSVSDSWANVTAYKIVAVEDDSGKKFFERRPWKRSGDHVEHIDKAESYLDGWVKWDGCSELNQGKPHWCGPNDFKHHMALLKYIYLRAFELMGREPEEPWTDKALPPMKAK